MEAVATETLKKRKASPTMDVLHEIYRLPISERMYIVERTIHSVRAEDSVHSLEKAVNLMADEYRTNKELTAFTHLDNADFHETR
ncbi:hypothetical protein [Candidatus Symbiothrix dinenymphae]|uniref:hypothetical protein n=1 Tax=Candidatus Symbiothrix dinenymphae TaxID=467085 RepID=UPI0007036AA6|nr:hypothetical protein [Candidatus Symbiothrix dinenymphae]